MSLPIKGLIFDVDGTLAETEELHRKAFNKVFEQEKINWYWDRSIYKELLKVAGGKERISFFQENYQSNELLLNKKDIINIHRKKTLFYQRCIKEGLIELRPGIREIITLAKNRGITLAVSTSTSFQNVDSLCRSCFNLDPREIFEFISTGDLVKRKKPNPELYELVLKNLKIKPRECFAIEDSRIGMLASKTAKIPTIVCPSFYSLDDDLKESDYVVKNFNHYNLPKSLKLALQS